MSTQLDDEIAKLSKSIDWIIESRAELIAALKLAIDTIQAWHGMGMGPWHGMGIGPAEREAWLLYQQSPEMKQINAAIAKAEGR